MAQPVELFPKLQMKTTVLLPQEIEIKSVRLNLHIRSEDEDMPYTFPLRSGDRWIAEIDIDTGTIKGWPAGEAGEFYTKVCDEGTYSLIGPSGKVIAELKNDYVPHGVIPGKYGDYAHLKIDADGRISNWPKKPDVSAFFSEND